jgi:hypothetical protein
MAWKSFFAREITAVDTFLEAVSISVQGFNEKIKAIWKKQSLKRILAGISDPIEP